MRASDGREQNCAPGGFATTQWSLISRATAPSAEGRAALEALCRAYWFPVYAFARKQGCNASDAEDVTQDFFAEIVQSEFLQRADPGRGRFRSYLLTAVKRRIINAHDRATAKKRGGSTRLVSIDEPLAETTISRDRRSWPRSQPNLRAECISFTRPRARSAARSPHPPGTHPPRALD